MPSSTIIQSHRNHLNAFSACFFLLFLQLLLQQQHILCIDYFDPSSSLNRQQQQQSQQQRVGLGVPPPSPADQQRLLQRQQYGASGGGRIGNGGINNPNNPTYQQQQPQQQQRSSNFLSPQHQLASATNFAAHQAAGILPFGGGLTNNQQQQQLDLNEFGRQLQQNATNNGNNIGSSMNNPTNSDISGNVLVEIHLRSFANPGFRLPNNRLCTCPQGNDHCLQASPQRNGYNCLTSVSVFVLSADSDLKYIETPYYPLNQGGQLGFEQFPMPYQFHLDSPPSAIGVLVHNLGPQINPDGTLYETNTVTTVDQYTQSLNGTLPGGGGSGGASSSSPFGGGGGGNWGQQQQQNVNLQGRLLGTQLSLSYSVSCRGGRGADGRPLVGPGCDLSCNTSSATTNTAICISHKTGYYSQCRWTAGNTQVTNCQNCPWGIKEDAYCADAQGGVLQPDHAGVVSSFYYKAFVVLCAICALLLILFVLLCLIVISRRNIKNRRHRGSAAAAAAGSAIRAPPASSSRNNPNDVAAAAGFLHRGEPQAAALSSAAFRLENAGCNGNKAPPPYTIRSNISGPLPVPRSNASTASANSSSDMTAGGGGSGRRFPPILPPLVVGGKSGKALSPPRYQPLPHLGPAGGGGADSLNTSFAGSQTVPLPPPSVSADV